MVGPGDDFEDSHDEEAQGPLLPPEDRLWRHPSELFASGGSPQGEQTSEARRRWLQTTPSRAGAGAAGVVGAILAAGVVLLGTHVTSWLGPHGQATSGRAQSLKATVTTTAATLAPSVAANGISSIFSTLTGALVRVQAVRSSATSEGDGVIVSASGEILVPFELVSGASSVTVVRSDGEQLIASVVGTDQATGIALLHVEEPNLPHLGFSTARTPPARSFALVAWWANSVEVTLARTGASPTTASLGNGPALLEACQSSLGLASAPIGSVVVGSDGSLEEFVTAHQGHETLAAPGWLAHRVVSELARHGRVVHGWLGIKGVTGHAPAPANSAGPGRGGGHLGGEVTGVKVVAVEADSAAAAVGLRTGDVITAIDGQPVSSMAALQADLYLMPPSSSVKLALVRGHERTAVRATLKPAA